MNYQYLHYDFFTTCRKRKITKTPMLLLIYLRGLYSRFGNIFTWKDKTIVNDLGINRKMLQRSRLILREKGVIDFVSGTGLETTQYLILDSVLAPERVDKNSQGLDKTSQRGGHIVHPMYKSNERVKNRIGDERKDRFRGMTDKEREWLRKL